jgi:hypothetical protein
MVTDSNGEVGTEPQPLSLFDFHTAGEGQPEYESQNDVLIVVCDERTQKVSMAVYIA